jgi:AcrR family transcriptional regulator
VSCAPATTRARKGEGQQLRETLLAVTERLLVENGDASRVSVRAIVNAVGRTSPVLYRHFANKRELMWAVCERQWQQLETMMFETTALGCDPVDAIRRAGRAYVRFGVDNPHVYRMLFTMRPDVEELKRVAGFDRLVDLVETAIHASAIEAAEPFAVACGLWAALHGLTSLLVDWPWFPWPPYDKLLAHLVDAQLHARRPLESYNLNGIR